MWFVAINDRMFQFGLLLLEIAYLECFWSVHERDEDTNVENLAMWTQQCVVGKRDLLAVCGMNCELQWMCGDYSVLLTLTRIINFDVDFAVLFCCIFLWVTFLPFQRFKWNHCTVYLLDYIQNCISVPLMKECFILCFITFWFGIMDRQ